MTIKAKSPVEYDWQYGELPDVNDVDECCIIIFFEDSNFLCIGLVFPIEDKYKRRSWYSKGNSTPLDKACSLIGWWAYYRRDCNENIQAD